MGNQRLRHDAAVAIAQATLDVVGNCIRPEERRDAFEEFYRIALAGLESYDIMRERMMLRLNPTRN